MTRWFGRRTFLVWILQVLATAAVCISVYYAARNFCRWGHGRAEEAVLAASGITIAFYKAAAKMTQRSSGHEAAIRDGLHGIFHNMNRKRAVVAAKLLPHREILDDICAVVRRDLQEFLQVSEDDVFVMMLRYNADRGGSSAGILEQVGRSSPPGSGWPDGESRDALSCVAYEAIRLLGMKTIHDTHAACFRQTFGPEHMKHRCMFFTPITSPGSAEPCGVLVVKFSHPYVLWPKLPIPIDCRLRVYAELANFCISGD